MSALDCSVAGPDQAHFGPVFLITTIASGLAALVGVGLALAGKHGADIVLQTTGALATWLAGSVFWMAGTQASAEARWQRRVTPSAAARRTRQGYAELRLQLVACASAGPAVMLVAQACVLPAGEVLSLTATCALQLAAAWLVGTWLGLRAPVLQLQRLRATLARLLGGWRHWRRVPTETELAQERGSGGDWIWLVWLPQCLTQGANWRFQGWGAALIGDGASAWTPAWAGVWMFMLGCISLSVTFAPPLHWRARLAPGGVGPAAWARRMWVGSVLAMWACVLLGWALGALFTDAAYRAAQFSSGLPAVADALLAMAWVLWWRSRRNTGASCLVAAVTGGLAVGLGLWAAQACGVTLHRSWLLVAAEVAVAALLAADGVRAWAQQDFNRLMPRAWRP